MKFFAPDFWYAGRHPLAYVLLPLSWIWRFAAYLRAALTKPYTSGVKVICVGNIAVGGTGKTPACIALATRFQDKKIAFLTRGYGGRQRNPVVIRHATDAAQYGDEAVLLSRHAPVIVAANRARGLKVAEQQGFDIVIADDGFQNPSFTKDISVLVINGATGLGNGFVMPAGPLRETPASAAARAGAVLIVGPDATHVSDAFPGLPILNAHFSLLPGAPDVSVPYVAFAGIGQPQKFFNTLGDAGYVIAETVSFPDHHAYTGADLDRLQRLAARHNARLITTEKDYVRLLPAANVNIATLPVALAIEGDLDGILK